MKTHTHTHTHTHTQTTQDIAGIRKIDKHKLPNKKDQRYAADAIRNIIFKNSGVCSRHIEKFEKSREIENEKNRIHNIDPSILFPRWNQDNQESIDRCYGGGGEINMFSWKTIYEYMFIRDTTAMDDDFGGPPKEPILEEEFLYLFFKFTEFFGMNSEDKKYKPEQLIGAQDDLMTSLKFIQLINFQELCVQVCMYQYNEKYHLANREPWRKYALKENKNKEDINKNKLSQNIWKQAIEIYTFLTEYQQHIIRYHQNFSMMSITTEFDEFGGSSGGGGSFGGGGLLSIGAQFGL